MVARKLKAWRPLDQIDDWRSGRELAQDVLKDAGVKAVEVFYCHDDGPSVRDPL
jgi:hypothetical protein